MDDEPRAEAGSGQRTTIRWLVAALVVLGLAAAARFLPFGPWIEALRRWLDGAGPLGLVVFALTYVAATVLLVPGSALTLVAGAAFGLGWATATVSIASTTGAAIAFLLARTFLRGAVEKRARAHPRFAAIDRAIGSGGWRIVALLRLSPAIPFNVSNYLYGLTAIRFWPYVLASWIAMLPATFLYAYAGHLGAESLSAARGGPADAGRLVLLGLGLLATVAVTVYVARLARRAIRAETDVAAV